MLHVVSSPLPRAIVLVLGLLHLKLVPCETLCDVLECLSQDGDAVYLDAPWPTVLLQESLNIVRRVDDGNRQSHASEYGGKGGKGGQRDESSDLVPAAVEGGEAKAGLGHATLTTVLLFMALGCLLGGLAVYIASSISVASALTPRRNSESILSNRSMHSRLSLTQLEADGHEIHTNEIDKLDEDMYGLAIATILCDSLEIAKGQKAGLRTIHIGMSVTVQLAVLIMQASLLAQIKWYVTPTAVDGIRRAYSEYELVMYGNHTTLTENGFYRGVPGFLDPNGFADLDEGTKAEVCSIPFSQLIFLMIVLLIWTMTCTMQLKRCLELLVTLIYATPVVASVVDGVREEPSDNGENEIVIVGLPPWAKALITSCILLPWFGSTVYLLWLGCRWLAATNEFGSLVSNAVALEFILLFKDLFYSLLVPARAKANVRRTGIPPPTTSEPVGCSHVLGSFVWGMLAFAWVWLYVFHLQRILPDYNWDLQGVCAKWLGDKMRKQALE